MFKEKERTRSVYSGDTMATHVRFGNLFKDLTGPAPSEWVEIELSMWRCRDFR